MTMEKMEGANGTPIATAESTKRHEPEPADISSKFIFEDISCKKRKTSLSILPEKNEIKESQPQSKPYEDQDQYDKGALDEKEVVEYFLAHDDTQGLKDNVNTKNDIAITNDTNESEKNQYNENSHSNRKKGIKDAKIDTINIDKKSHKIYQAFMGEMKFNNECNVGQNAAENKLERFEVGNDKSAVDDCTIIENLKEKANNVMDVRTEKTPCVNVNDSKDKDEIQTSGNKTFINTSDSEGKLKNTEEKHMNIEESNCNGDKNSSKTDINKTKLNDANINMTKISNPNNNMIVSKHEFSEGNIQTRNGINEKVDVKSRFKGVVDKNIIQKPMKMPTLVTSNPPVNKNNNNRFQLKSTKTCKINNKSSTYSSGHGKLKGSNLDSLLQKNALVDVSSVISSTNQPLRITTPLLAGKGEPGAIFNTSSKSVPNVPNQTTTSDKSLTEIKIDSSTASGKTARNFTTKTNMDSQVNNGSFNLNSTSDGTDKGTIVMSAATNTQQHALLPATKVPREQLSEKKLRRLEKNRLSARECRRRKRLAAEELEREIKRVESENLRLKLQLKVGEEAEESAMRKQAKVTNILDNLLKSNASDSDIFHAVEDFKEKFADYGRDRRSAIEFHFRNISRLIMPTTTTSVALRALKGGSLISPPTSSSSPPPSLTSMTQQPNAHTFLTQRTDQIGNSCYQNNVSTGPDKCTGSMTPLSNNLMSSSANTGSMNSNNMQLNSSALSPKALFSLLVEHLQVNPEQGKALKDSRWVAQELDSSLAQSLTVLNELRCRFMQLGMDLEQEFDEIRNIMSPTQSAKFLIWVSKNDACMHMLNELWNKTYSLKSMPSPQPQVSTETSKPITTPSTFSKKSRQHIPPLGHPSHSSCHPTPPPRPLMPLHHPNAKIPQVPVGNNAFVPHSAINTQSKTTMALPPPPFHDNVVNTIDKSDKSIYDTTQVVPPNSTLLGGITIPTMPRRPSSLSAPMRVHSSDAHISVATTGLARKELK